MPKDTLAARPSLAGWWGNTPVFQPGLIAASYATGNVSAEREAGGLVGNHNANSRGGVIASYATGRVTSEGYAGGLVGVSRAGIVDSYFDADTSGLTAGLGNGAFDQ